MRISLTQLAFTCALLAAIVPLSPATPQTTTAHLPPGPTNYGTFNTPCIPWESPDGGSRDIVFDRPVLNDPSGGGYLTIPDPADPEKSIPHGFPVAMEDDGLIGPSDPVSAAGDWWDDPIDGEVVEKNGAKVTVAIENHLTRTLTGPNFQNLGGGPGDCLEVFVKWQAYRIVTITEIIGVGVEGSNPVTVSRKVREFYHVVRLTEVCPC